MKSRGAGSRLRESEQRMRGLTATPIAQQIQPPEIGGTEESLGPFRRRRRYTRGGVGAGARQREVQTPKPDPLGRSSWPVPEERDADRCPISQGLSVFDLAPLGASETGPVGEELDQRKLSENGAGAWG